ncbi:MAG: hypothetical protein QMD46_09945 [Methanomicrobiales archaeon]|nr:hypothetical protein [Methanomicrobiales archaeon]
MHEKSGHFERGRWVEDPAAGPAPVEAPAAPGTAPGIDQLGSEALQSVQKAVDDVLRFGRHLFLTPEGREQIERKVQKTAAELEQAIQSVAEAARKRVEKKE